MTYSSGMPILYLIAAINLYLLYIIDKYFIVRIVKKPKNFDAAMQKLTRGVMFAAPVIHAIIAIFVYGNEEIFNDTASEATFFAFPTLDNTNSDNLLNKFYIRVT